MLLLTCFFVGIKEDLVSSWDGMSQFSKITVMFVVKLKKSFKVIVEPEKIENET